jgi:aspartate kinase
VAASIFRDLARDDVNVRLIIQAAATHDRNRITFVTDADQVDLVRALEGTWRRRGTVGEILIDTKVAKIAIVGSRIASTPGLAARMFSALARNHVNIDCISTSEMKVSCVIAATDLDQGVRAVHAEFFGNAATPRARKSATTTAASKAAVKKTRKATIAKKVAKRPVAAKAAGRR